MKIALYVEDGLEQIVLTPTSETEKAILEKVHDESRDVSLRRGTFYGCRGGWTRWRDSQHGIYDGIVPASDREESTMIVLTAKDPTQLSGAK